MRQAHPPGAALRLLLGQAGDRSDAAIADLAAVAAAHAPDHVVLKDMDGYLRGRGSGEVAHLLRAALVGQGVPDAAIQDCLDESAAVRLVLQSAGPGDSLVLPVHGAAGRARATTLLDQLEGQGWAAGEPLPEADHIG